jgi:pyrrolidone-carboxylate peptidase
MTVLVTGFGPYGNTPTNPAQKVAEFARLSALALLASLRRY